MVAQSRNKYLAIQKFKRDPIVAPIVNIIVPNITPNKAPAEKLKGVVVIIIGVDDAIIIIITNAAY
jgi:hypothetical protein